ncbi:exopolyphosphatase / guanosine-5'-triphosphate,3'-diphosphate pyrophosphatase [Amphibacillus marinus]|uniref:Exopolyphosphatase / guanosine-5'-triphosphate,3'-diphosphate pyrophosphatase n=1 Tax=Amphibacillus marinus TaxID=872970 RepID=A0A1H8RGB8_9BACI|nr:Ppx/GppA family phosphatase [Amphibacillus marinus]SEO65465.1 exopolyphosphatase / guanosine-5'-triphosphate,3'-diphosphate pyrophosphatase [Amphibacillus marinus]
MSKVNKDYHAIIDIGSNTMRLVIYLQEQTGRFRKVENVKAVARLRNHLDTDNHLTEQGQTILINTLTDFKSVLKIYPLTHFACVATATIRQAANNKQLVKRVKDEFNWTMRILSEDEEAYYGYLAVVNSTSIREGLTIDMGGGSTEVTYFKDRKLINQHSFPFGTLTLSNLLNDDRSNEENFRVIKQFVNKQFQTLSWLKDRHVPLIAIGGSARNLAQIDQEDKAYPMASLHQYQMTEADIVRINDHLQSLPAKKLQKVEGLSRDRADIIIPAIETFLSLYRFAKADGFILSQKGLREGVNYQLLLANQPNHLFPNVLTDSIQELINDFDLNMKQIHHVQSLTRKLFNKLVSKKVKMLNKKDWQLLKQAANVYNLGDYIDTESSAQHTFYILANRSIDGLMHIDKLKLALVSSFKNKTVYKQFTKPYKNWLTKKEREKLQLLGALLKFTYCLDATKRQIIKDFDLKISRRTIKLTLYCSENASSEAYQSEKQKKHIEQALGRKINMRFVKQQTT